MKFFVTGATGFIGENLCKRLTAEHFVFTSQHLQQDLQWQAVHNLEMSIRKAYQGYQQAGWLE